MAAALAETKKLRDQEQISLQARLRSEKEAVQREKKFQEDAIEVARRAAEESARAKKTVPMRMCPRCDKQTPQSNNKCEHCNSKSRVLIC